MSPRHSPTPPAWLAGRCLGRLASGLTVATALAFGVASGCSSASGAPTEKSPEKAQFFYSAGAFAVGGAITQINGKPPAEPLLVQAATLLPPSGGKGVGRIEKAFQYGPVETKDAKWVITVGSASAEVNGTQDGDCHVTTVTNTITDLNVLGRIEAARLVIEAESRHCLKGSARETRFHVVRATFDGLRIDGVLLQPELAKSFAGAQTFSELAAGQQAAYERSQREHAAAGGTSVAAADGRRPGPSDGMSLDRRLLLTSIFAPVGEGQLNDLQKANKHPEAGRYRLLADNGIHVPDLGNVHFGRCLVDRNKRETVMLHLELGSPVKGPIDIGGEYGNGVDYP